MSKLRLIQAGVGGMGGTWWKGAVKNSPDFDVVAIVDINDQPLAEAGDGLNIPTDRRFKSLKDALNAVEADAVLTVTPPAVHVEHARLAFARGLHLLSEKPLADTLKNAKLMVALAKKARRQLLIAQNYRYSAVIHKLKQLLDEKPVGAFGHGHLDFYIPADFTGSFREAMQFPLLVDMTIHHIDLIRHVTGKNINKVTAQTFKPAWSWYKHHPGLKMMLELEDGLPFSYSGDWTARGRTTPWNGHWRLQCAEGSIHLEDDKLTIARCERWMKNPASESIDAPAIERTAQTALLHNFAESIRTKKPAETSGADNLWSFATVMAGVKSAQTGKTIKVRDLIQ